MCVRAFVCVHMCGLCFCLCKWANTCRRMCTCVCVHVWGRVCVCVCECVGVCVHVSTHACVYVWACLCVCVFVRV